MAIEIERKYLIIADKLPVLEKGIYIKQGYIPTTNGTTVRVRVAGDHAFVCIKGPTDNISRAEYDFAIPESDAREMLEGLCHGGKVEKYRHLLNFQEITWELDVFSGANQGLIVAEIELQSEDQAFVLPAWVGEEVTYDSRYSNFNLASNPFSKW